MEFKDFGLEQGIMAVSYTHLLLMLISLFSLIASCIV